MKIKLSLSRVAMAAVVTAMPLLSTSAMASSDGVAAVKGFLVDYGDRMLADTQAMETAAQRYYDILKAENFDYAKAALAHGPELQALVEEMRQSWLKAHDNYENVEGIVAGIPSLADYDLILDAGAPGTEEEDVAPFDMTLPDGTVMEKPGNLFHVHLETALWGTNPDNVGLATDLNGDGKVSVNEILPEANILLGAADAHEMWTGKMLADVKAWEANRDDVFTAIVTMVPTVGDYFGEWKESKYVTGDIGMFVAQSRLNDVMGIMRSTKVMYFEGISDDVAAADPTLDAQIHDAFLELLDFVNEVYLDEKAGTVFAPEEVDRLGSEAQDIADRIVAMVVQAAAKLDVKLKI
jgi:hypothetical protein